MLPSSNKGLGTNVGFPDVCLTPTPGGPVPIPYPNIAMNAMSALFCFIVKTSFVNALNMISKIAMTFGDEGGVAHATMKGMGGYTMGNPKVFIEKTPGISFGCPTNGNNMNNPLGIVAVPSLTNVFYSYAAPAPTDRMSDEDHRAVVERTRRPAELEVSRDGRIGVIAVPCFSNDLPAAMYDAIRTLEADGLDGLVIDLRGNPGGELVAMIEVAGEFLEEDALIVTVTDIDGDEEEHEARRDGPYRFPLAIVVDGDTGSAAETFAGSLQAHGRATVFGTRTHGKGSVQAVVQPDGVGAPLYATVAACSLPGGGTLDDGVEPDHEGAIHEAVAYVRAASEEC